MQCKTGADHIKSLQDGRAVYIDGARVDDVTTHPAYRNAVASAASLYDYQARPENLELMSFVPNGGSRRAQPLLANASAATTNLVQRRSARRRLGRKYLTASWAVRPITSPPH